MEGTVLGPEQGITHDVFGSTFTRVDQPPEPTAEGEEVKATDETREEPDILVRYKHIYVKEVVREPRMNFQRVPRLGSYMAIPMIYKSCLFDEALTEAVQNFQDVQAKKAQQEADQQAHESVQQQ